MPRMTTPLKRQAYLILALGALLTFPAAGEDAKPPAEGGGYDMAAMEEAMRKAATPGEHHRFLAIMEGAWTFTNTLWMDPSKPPVKSEGASKKAMILGGRYLQEESTGEVMGQTFHGRGVTAYDNTAGEFIGTWIDDMSTGLAVLRGERDGKTLTTHGDYLDPMSGQTMKIRAVTQVVDRDHHIFEYYMTMPGAPEFKSMEIAYTRKSAD